MSAQSDGMYFDDFKVGMKFSGRVGRTLTDQDNIWFSLLTNNSNQIHFNRDYTRKYYSAEPFKGRLVVNGLLTLSVVVGILVESTSANGFMLGIQNVGFPKPVFDGDTIYAACEVTGVKESASRPGNGIVTLRTWGVNQDGDRVIEFDRTFMVRKRGSTWS